MGGGLLRKRQCVVRQPGLYGTRGGSGSPDRVTRAPPPGLGGSRETPAHREPPPPENLALPQTDCCETRTPGTAPGPAAARPRPRPSNSGAAPRSAAARTPPAGNPRPPTTITPTLPAARPPRALRRRHDRTLPPPRAPPPAAPRPARSPPAAPERLPGKAGSRRGRRTAPQRQSSRSEVVAVAARRGLRLLSRALRPPLANGRARPRPHGGHGERPRGLGRPLRSRRPHSRPAVRAHPGFVLRHLVLLRPGALKPREPFPKLNRY